MKNKKVTQVIAFILVLLMLLGIVPSVMSFF